MFCQNCGSEVDEGALFCGKCGSQVVLAASRTGNVTEQATATSSAEASDAGGATEQATAEQTAGSQNDKKEKKKIFLIAGICAAAVIMAITITSIATKKTATADGFIEYDGKHVSLKTVSDDKDGLCLLVELHGDLADAFYDEVGIEGGLAVTNVPRELLLVNDAQKWLQVVKQADTALPSLASFSDFFNFSGLYIDIYDINASLPETNALLTKVERLLPVLEQSDFSEDPLEKAEKVFNKNFELKKIGSSDARYAAISFEALTEILKPFEKLVQPVAEIISETDWDAFGKEVNIIDRHLAGLVAEEEQQLQQLFYDGGVLEADFVYAIQDLAVLAACNATYSMTDAYGGWQKDLHDYYTPQNMKTRFAMMSGEKTETRTSYGVCFNYAEAALRYLDDYTDIYRKVGLAQYAAKGDQYFMALAFEDPNTIQAAIIGTPDNYTMVSNGVHVKVVENGEQKVATHDGATRHAWLWLQRADGVWFWLDPTWTDNLGYVVYGFVSDGKEIQCRPDKRLCINYPTELDSLPSPPKMGNSIDDYSDIKGKMSLKEKYDNISQLATQLEIFSEGFRLTERTLVDSGVTVPWQGHVPIYFKVSGEGTVSIEAKFDRTVKFMTMDRYDYENRISTLFTNEYYPALSQRDSATMEKKARLPAGDYVLIVECVGLHVHQRYGKVTIKENFLD